MVGLPMPGESLSQRKRRSVLIFDYDTLAIAKTIMDLAGM